MNLYKVTYDSKISISDFYSPLFYEAENEIDSLSKFMKDCEKHLSPHFSFKPQNITATKICKLKEIRK